MTACTLSFGLAVKKGLMAAVAVLLAVMPTAMLAAAPAATPHDREFWRTIAKNNYAIPDGQQVFPLVRELSGYLGSTDPELRDELGYSILEDWIVEKKQFSANELNSLADEWQANLRIAIGESGTDTVFKRSFSALCLSLLANRELKTPFLGKERYQALLDNALTYLKDERDLRAFDQKKGWIHATAHTADLLAQLADNPLLKVQDQARLLDAISDRLSSAHEVFAYGEQSRLSSVAAEIVIRPDFDAKAFQLWLSHLQEAEAIFKESPPKQEPLKAFQNQSYMLWGLAGHLAMQTPNPAITSTHQAVIEILRRR